MTATHEQTAGCTWPAGCRNKVGLQPAAAAGGALRCSWHDPDRRGAQLEARKRSGGQPPVTVKDEDLPVQEINSLEDAKALARWLPIAIATGRLGGREAQAAVGALREYRMALADAGVMQELERLVADARRDAAELADLRRRVAAARERGVEV